MNRRRQNNKVRVLQRWYQFDYNLLLAVFFLLCFGLVMLYSMSYYTAISEGRVGTYYLTGQLVNVVIGVVGMFGAAMISRHWYGRWSCPIYWMSIGLLLYVELNGVVLNGAKRWMSIGGKLFQPSELTKVTCILFVSFLICKYREKLGEWSCWIKIVAIAFVSFFCVLKFTDNLSTAIIIAGICMGILLVALPRGGSWMIGMLIVIVVVYAGIRIGGLDLVEQITETFNMENYRAERIIVWLDPTQYSDDGGYQTLQGLYALGAGGWLGKGLGNGTQKLDVIPEVQNDMILAAIAEELGVFGVVLVLVLFAILLYRLYVIAKHAPDRFGALIVAGIFIHISIQVILNIAVVTNVIPNTGVTLPFISYGGTSVIVLLGEMGIALGISNNTKYEEEN